MKIKFDNVLVPQDKYRLADQIDSLKLKRMSGHEVRLKQPISTYLCSKMVIVFAFEVYIPSRHGLGRHKRKDLEAIYLKFCGKLSL